MREIACWCGALALFFARVCSAQGLADCVPADVGICIQAEELPAKVQAFFQGPIGRRALEHQAVASWRDQRDGDVKQFIAALEAHFDMPFADLCDGVAGREVLLGIWPESVPGSGDSPAVLLVRARDAQTLQKAYQSLYEEQQRNGRTRPGYETVIDGRRHRIHVVAPDEKDQLLYLATDGDLGLLCNSEQLATRVLRMAGAQRVSNGAPPPPGALASSATYRSAHMRLPSDSALSIFVNARAWDRTISASLEQPSDELSAEDRERLLSAWRATEYVVAGLSLGDDLHAEGVWRVDPAKLPAAAREVADAISGRAGFLEFVPHDALVAVSGRAQWGRLARLVWGELARGDRSPEESPGAAAAADVMVQLLEKLGPDCGAFVIPAPNKGPEKLPVELAFGLETRTRLPRELANTAADTVDQSLRSALAMVTVVYNQDHDSARADLKIGRVDGVLMTTLTGIVELGDIQPTYTMTANGVLVGTSRDAVAAAATIDAEQSLARSQRVARALADAWTSPSQVFYLDAKGLRALLESHEGLAHHFAKRSGESVEQARNGLAELARLLALADTLVAACRVEPDGVSAMLHIAAE